MRTADFLNTSEGSKYLLCDGSEIPSAYTKLRKLMTHTPDFRDRVPQGASMYALGTQIEAALPDLLGEFYIIYYAKYSSYTPKGVFKIGNETYPNPDIWARELPGWNEGRVNFQASNYSNIYKENCTTVQPPALAVNFYIKAK